MGSKVFLDSISIRKGMKKVIFFTEGFESTEEVEGSGGSTLILKSFRVLNSTLLAGQ